MVIFGISPEKDWDPHEQLMAKREKHIANKSFLYSKLWPWDLVPSHSSCCSAVRSWIYVAGGGVGGFAAITG